MFNSEIKKEKISFIIFLVLLIYLFFYMMRPFLMTLLLASIFVVLFYPLFEKLKNKLGKKPRLASFIVTISIFLIILVPITLITILVIDQIYDIVRNLNLKYLFKDLFDSEFYKQNVLPLVSDFESTMEWSPDLLETFSVYGKNLAKSISKFSPKVFLGTASFFFDFFIMIIGIYFLFLEGPRLLKIFYDISPIRDTHERRLFREFKNTIDASVVGYLVTSMVQAILATFAFYITGLDGSVVLGTLVFFMSMVPVVGAAGVWVPVCVWLFFQGEIGWGVFNTVWGVVVISGIDNILKPMIIQGRTKIHPLLVFFSLFGGIGLFGPLGILFGPVITATLIATIRIYRDEYL